MNSKLKISLSSVALLLTLSTPQLIFGQTVPYSGNATKVDGPGSSGGGNGCQGKMYEDETYSPLVNPARIVGLTDFIQKMETWKKQAEEANDPITMRILSQFLQKRWYLLSCALQPLSAEELGKNHAGNQHVIQNLTELFVSVPSLGLDKPNNSVYTMLLHEMLIGGLQEISMGLEQVCRKNNIPNYNDCGYGAISIYYMHNKSDDRETPARLVNSEMFVLYSTTSLQLKDYYPRLRTTVIELLEQGPSLSYPDLTRILSKNLPIFSQFKNDFINKRATELRKKDFQKFSEHDGLTPAERMGVINKVHQKAIAKIINNSSIKINEQITLNDLTYIIDYGTSGAIANIYRNLRGMPLLKSTQQKVSYVTTFSDSEFGTRELKMTVWYSFGYTTTNYQRDLPFKPEIKIEKVLFSTRSIESYTDWALDKVIQRLYPRYEQPGYREYLVNFDNWSSLQ